MSHTPSPLPSLVLNIFLRGGGSDGACLKRPPPLLQFPIRSVRGVYKEELCTASHIVRAERRAEPCLAEAKEERVSEKVALSDTGRSFVTTSRALPSLQFRISGLIYEETRGVLKVFLENVIRDAEDSPGPHSLWLRRLKLGLDFTAHPINPKALFRATHFVTKRPNLITLTPSTPDKLPSIYIDPPDTEKEILIQAAPKHLDVFGHDCDPLSVDGAQVGILKETHQVREAAQTMSDVRGGRAPSSGIMSVMSRESKQPKKAAGVKKAAKPSGPSVSELIVKAVSASKERSGVSLAALKKALAASGYDVEKNNSRLKLALKGLVTKSTLVQVKGSGASGSFKLNKKQAESKDKAAKKKAPAKVKKPAPKKATKSPAKPKKVAAKSPKKAKKPAASAKKATKSPKKVKAAKPKKAVKSPAKKTVKSPAKKAAKPKAAKSPAKAKKAKAKAARVCPAERSTEKAVAVAARDIDRATDFAKTHSIPKVHGSYEELAKDPNIDVIYVGAVHTVHLDLVLMFMKNQKNVLCEKPLAMDCTEAVWSRFFPVYHQIRSLLTQNVIGEVKIVRAEFGFNLLHVERVVQKDLGGGALLDIGCYCIQFALMAFNGEKPESITAKGFLHETGVDETVTIIIQFAGKRQAILTCSIAVELPNQAVISGTKGTIQIPSFFWCPTSLIVNGKETNYPVPPTTKYLHFLNSTGLSYQAEHVRQCLLKGLKESPVMSLAESEFLASIMEEVHKQLGVTYPQNRH
ncbi:trans-1,2-dihydrobenzene-1,2-diol dehydrogenase [Pelobates cultripes]|uniref:Trans-1,2-dihydrobenzene-1,2-diol dehydrogenase n=1 Tax=Pelobates cultripes TaxID=61616 RepID=A0AAD1T5A5_PELCU|nr:trans-1,2-dihydrobenzene-1,2-diol dehydrogenase [Pelobates cultripes]